MTPSNAAYWDGRNAVGERVASGIYFYTFANIRFCCNPTDGYPEVRNAANTISHKRLGVDTKAFFQNAEEIPCKNVSEKRKGTK